MYHANFLALVIGKLLRKKIIWGLHHSDLSDENNKRSTIMIANQLGKFSKFINQVVSCGENVQKEHVRYGYSSKNNIVIPNGFDTSNFSPTNRLTNFKRQMKIPENKKIMLHVARWHPLKDYSNLLKSINKLRNLREDFVLLLVGEKIHKDNLDLMNMINKYDLTNLVFLLGRREDIPVLMASADFFVSSSVGEGFPNVIGEAMMSGLYCVVTDAGDSRNIVGSFGEVVPVNDSFALANGLNSSLELTDQKIKRITTKARARVTEKFDIENVTKEYEKVYDSI